MLLLSATAFAIDWPSGFQLEEETTSPDGRLGILSADGKAFHRDEDHAKAARLMYLADLKEHRIIKDIAIPGYSEARYLEVNWDADSSACVLVHRARHSLLGIELVELTRHGARRTDLGGVVSRALDQTYLCCRVDCHFRFLTDGRLMVRCLGDDNPRELQDKERTFGLFTGVFDRRKSRWSSSKSGVLDEGQYQTLVEAFEPWTPPGGSNGDVLHAMEERMRVLGNGLEAVLTRERYRDFQRDQDVWKGAAKNGEAAVVDSECVRFAERLAKMEALLWQP
ncbi:hypothetical protein KBB96_19795 [Luteolibacter ambystomatis]|uniref:Uncharacterized protein n=1 Tax=Luteolibacter ambystomatis TaxID=2824561 RepID=A0A975G977_9BACT|nr:hypothetical protein [Luteolibacter ambystomatis]QUE51086.1 hypothetical protein KBB96_19795 [Luteolibacter ambystomatis]